MRMTITYEGETYESEETDEITMQAAHDAIYGHMAKLDKLTINLLGGRKLVMGREAVQRAVLVFYP